MQQYTVTAFGYMIPLDNFNKWLTQADTPDVLMMMRMRTHLGTNNGLLCFKDFEKMTHDKHLLTAEELEQLGNVDKKLVDQYTTFFTRQGLQLSKPALYTMHVDLTCETNGAT